MRDPKKVDGRYLAKRFAQFNQTYFDGRLPKYAIRVLDRITWLGECGHINRKRRLIRIQRGLGHEQSISTLLHEMVHAATNDLHGKAWTSEMIRLRKSGAPLAPPDSEIQPSDASRGPTKAHFMDVCRDALAYRPEATLNQLVRWYIYSYGGQDQTTVAGFIRKYSWCRSAFNAVSVEVKELRERRATRRHAR